MMEGSGGEQSSNTIYCNNTVNNTTFNENKGKSVKNSDMIK